MSDELKNRVKEAHRAVVQAQGLWYDAHQVLLIKQREFNEAVDALAATRTSGTEGAAK